MSDDRSVQLERLIEVGRYNDARRILRDALTERPDDPDLALYAARIAMLERDLAEARKHLENALAADPTSFLGRWLLYHVELDEERLAPAELLITDLIREFPEDATLMAAYAKLTLRALQLEKSRQLVDEALRLDPEDRSARITDVVLSTIEGRRDRAEEQLEELVKEDPEAWDVVTTVIVALTQAHRATEALELTQQLLRARPDDPALVDVIVQLRMQTHPLALPLRPMARYGWAASAAIWLVAIVVLQGLRRTENPWALTAGGVYLAFVLYTWIYPPLMTRWLRARGV